MEQLKLERNKFYATLSYLSEINSTSLLDMDFGDLFDDGKDLTKDEKESYFWGCERLNKIDTF